IEANLDREGVADELDCTLAHQNRNPVKLLLSGPETRSATGWEMHGKVRYERRVAWWDGYAGPALCVFGHYWRTALAGEKPIEQLFEGRAREQALGSGHAMCLDYSVGKRFRERMEPGFRGSFRTQLAALRLPERVLVFDNEAGETPLLI